MPDTDGLPRDGSEARTQLSDLLRRIAEGDREAFTDFYLHTCRRVNSLARRVIIDSDLSSDTSQEIYLIVWQDAHKYNERIGSPMAWLMTITHRRAVDKVRSTQSSANRDALWARSGQDREHDEVSEAALNNIETARVSECLSSLTGLQREAIVLAYYRGLTYRQAAGQLAIPLSTLKHRIRSGLIRLRECIGDD